MNKAIFLLPLLLMAVMASPLTMAIKQRSIENNPLKFTGRVLGVEKISEDAGSIGFKVRLHLTFGNVGRDPIIIYRYNLWVGATLIAQSLDDALAAKYLHRSSAWPSVWGKASRAALRQKLNQPIPPEDITQIVKPSESYEYDTIAYLGFDKKQKYDGTGKAWAEIKQASPVWLQVTLEMWPVNAELKVNRENPEFGKELRRRWKNAGYLWLDYLTSEPMKLDIVSGLN